MFDWKRNLSASILMVVFGVVSGPAAFAQDGWRVSKSTGEVWVTSTGVQPASLSDTATLNPGDTIRTGRTGRVLLVRGDEKIMISPNSVIGLPLAQNQGRTTTIVQQSGSILLEVEKRNYQHFEVETPFLAAVVRGTQFRVSVSRNESYVNVTRGQVEVTDFRSGQIANVFPGQMAKVWALGMPGLTLTGSGRLSPIQNGTPRSTTVPLIDIPADGLSAPAGNGPGQQVRVALPRGEGVSFPMEFGGREFNDSVWSAVTDSVARMFGRSDSQRSRTENDLAILSVPLGFGAVIAMAAAVIRRKRKQTPPQA